MIPSMTRRERSPNCLTICESECTPYARWQGVLAMQARVVKTLGRTKNPVILRLE